MRERTVYLVDGSAQLHRAYFAIRGLATSRGLPTNASYGFTTMLRKLLQDEAPEWIGISFDLKTKTFRHEEYAAYKANRPRMDDDLAAQIPYVHRVCAVLGLQILEVEGFEADDVIATLARQAVDKGMRVVVVSGDKDLLQLVSRDVAVLNPGREGAGATLYDESKVEEKMGVPPGRVADVLALVGDAVDNVPGVAGIGDKGARELIREYGSLEAVLENVDSIKRPSYREGLRAHRDDALLSKRLVTLRTDAPVTLDLERLRRGEPDREAAHALFSELEFVALAREFLPESGAAGISRRVAATEEEVRNVAAEAVRAERIALSVAAHGSGVRATAIGVGLSWCRGQAVFVPLSTSPLELPEALPPAQAAEILRPLLEDARKPKLSAAGKRDRVVLAASGHSLTGLAFDVSLAAYLVNPGRRSYALEELALEYLGERRSATSTPPGATPLDAVAVAVSEQAELVLRLYEPMTKRLREEGLDSVFETMELPLVEVLADMERAGVKVDRARLGALSAEMETEIASLTDEIHALAGQEFNINSPVQLREVLFDRLGLRPLRRTAKTRAASTAEEVLEELAATHPLPARILQYRGVQKLKSTYVDALPALINPETGRIHATFNQTIAATGRISSSEPNLQNIPIRTREGRRVREAFVAEEGHVLVSADYSQIELRILAHLSKDEGLIAAFRRGEDIHDRTARDVFGPFSPLAPEEQRRRSKMVNYALLYGKTAFTLAKDIGVGRPEAAAFIEAYFARYPGVRRFLDETLAEARASGTVRTLLGRLRRLPDLRAKGSQARAEAERQAVNTPVQGSAADLIKKAMVDLHAALRREGLKTRLILQIHDELLLEAPEAEAEAALALAKERMEGALALDVPLVVEARAGKTWADVH
jgi:DNA polymerase-1